MKRSTKLALSLALSAIMVAPALAQDNFPDVPANHWAYEALAKMKKDGLLVGYPDGLYRGGRPASRYELAVAMHAVYTNLKGLTDGLDSQLKALTDKVNGLGGGGVTPDDIKALKDAIAALQTDVSGMKSWGDDIASLKKATETFDKELKSLGVDVEAMKKDLGDIADRVKKLEARKLPVNISGDVNLVVFAGNSRDDRPGLTVDGRTTGFPDGAPAGLTRDLAILHEAAINLSGTNETGPTWGGTVVLGNLFDANPLSTLGSGSYTEGKSDVYLNDLWVKFDTSVAGLGFNATLGRVGYKVSEYILQRPITNSYISNDRWSNGKYTFDGAILGFNFGAAKLDVFGGKNSQILSNNGAELTPMVIGNGRVAGESAFSNIDRSLGLNFTTPLTTNGNLNLAYVWLQKDASNLLGTGANRLAVFGGSADFGFGNIKVSGGYSQSNLQANNSNVNDTKNKAWNGKVSYSTDKWGVQAGYREVENNYVAPGDWGRLGIVRNPANIKGFNVGAHLNISDALTLSAGGEFDKGKDSITGSLFNTDTKIDSYNVRLDYKVNSSLGAYLGYEDTKFKSLVGATEDSKYRWTTIGFNYGLSSAAKLNLQYQISDVSNEAFLGGATKYTGGFFSTQLTVKF